MSAVSLIVHEEEELLFEDRPAEVAAKLVQLQGPDGAAVEVVACIQNLVAEEIERSAVEIVAAALVMMFICGPSEKPLCAL